MELLLIVGSLLVLDILAMRYGVDSRILDVRDRRGWWSNQLHGDTSHDFALVHQAQLRYDASVERLGLAAVAARPSLRVRIANGLRALALSLEPPSHVPSTPATSSPNGVWAG